MKWTKYLNLGKTITKVKVYCLIKFAKYIGRSQSYLIVVSEYEKSLLEIYPLFYLERPYYRKKTLHIVGMAKDYEEALQMVTEMISDIYKKTGNTDVKSYFLDLPSSGMSL
ncbi:hypothetical protein FACS189418_0120 [Clostridia bacterium]|nr:hypothetical protein FACS189418_0120 [Clostridia bacterium]